MTSFELFEIFRLFEHYLIFYLLKITHFDKIKQLHIKA